MYPRHKTYFIRCTIFSLVWLFTLSTLKAQVIQEEPYNRFQYHKFKWRSFHTEAYHIYFPYGYDSLASFVAGELPEAMERIKHRMVTTLLNTPNVIIYPSVSHLYESNIGLYDIERKTLPTFVMNGSRLAVFFNGSHDDIKAQLYEGLVRSIWEAQVNAGIEGQARGTDAIPSWFSEGAIRYFAHHWPVEAEDELRRSFADNDFQSWQQVIAYQPRLSGQAFCYFLADAFYEQSVQQLFAQLKRKKDLRRSIRLIAKRELDSLYILCLDYYKKRFSSFEQESTDTALQALSIAHKKGVVTRILPGHDQENIAYIVSRNNKRKLYNYNIASATAEHISTYALPPWINDYKKDNYPVITWDSRKQLFVTQPLKKQVTIQQYTASGARTLKDYIAGIDGITNLQSGGRNTYILSGYRKGQSDIVTYEAGRERYQPVTNDGYDDTYIADDLMEQYFFRSSRHIEGDTTDILAQGIYTAQGLSVKKVVADTLPYVHWDNLQTISNSEVLATHTRYGIKRWAIVKTDGSITDLGLYSLARHSQPQNSIATFRKDRDSIYIATQPFESWIEQHQSDTRTSPWLQDYDKRAAQRAKEDSLLREARKNDQYSFLKDILIPKDAAEQKEAMEDSIANSLLFNPKKVKPYILQLHSAYFSATANNDYFINRYQPYLNYQGQFKFPELGAMLQAGFTDLFENHHIGIGYRVPTATEGSDFFISYKNTAKNLDWGLTYFRKVETVQADAQRMWVNERGKTYPNLTKVKTHYYQLSLSYPITYYLSVGFDQAFRNDRTIFLATDNYSLPFEDIKSLWSISTLSIRQYSLRPTIPLLQKGYAAKAYIDGFKAFSQNGEALYGVNAAMQYHLPVYRYITLVAQAKAGHSGGGSHILYNVAGADNNVTVKVDSTVHFPQAAPYSFQTLITPLRGYRQNTLYGNQYAALNADIYFPLFQTLIPIGTPLSFINNLQPGIFTDLATAGETWRKPSLKKGWYWSYGLSARSTLAGYTIRFDLAWPGRFAQKPLFYFSLKT